MGERRKNLRLSRFALFTFFRSVFYDLAKLRLNPTKKLQPYVILALNPAPTE